MKVDNKILRVRLRNGALTNFDPKRIEKAIFKAAKAGGGFSISYRPKINSFICNNRNDEEIARFLSTMVIMCLNRDPKHYVPNFPPHIEDIQNTIIHVLKSYGFMEIADLYAVYRWGKHWMRLGVITKDQFLKDGIPKEVTAKTLKWNRKHSCDTIDKLNEWVLRGNIKDLVDASVAAYEEQLKEAVKTFLERTGKGDKIRIMTIAGPSSSGKTTTTVKIRDRLKKEGVKLIMLNLDNYFWPIKEHPVDWIDDRDYETPDALDYQLINKHIQALLDGKKVRLPLYDFKTGSRKEGETFQIDRDSILLLDCLHGLYPPLTDGIPESQKFKIYLETLNIIKEGDESSRQVPFTDIRLLRRLVRDRTHRNHPPLNTILHWEKVRKSELYSIIPLIRTVDVIINGGLPFDLSALKKVSENIFPTEREIGRFNQLLDANIRYSRVRKTLDKVEAMQDISYNVIPGDCVVREFIGGSTIEIPHN